MKGLLLKDWYMAKKYCRVYLLIVIAFSAAFLFGDDNLFFIAYLSFIAGMIPLNLQGYDERSRWDIYSGTLPYTQTEIVSGKYLVALIAELSVLLLTGALQAIKWGYSGTFDGGMFFLTMSLQFLLSCMVPAVTLPPVFKWGVEKGRIMSSVLVGIIVGAITVGFLSETLAGVVFAGFADFSQRWILPVLYAVCPALYALSWYLSVRFYKKRQ